MDGGEDTGAQGEVRVREEAQVMSGSAGFVFGPAWLVLSVLVGWYAQNKMNRRFFPWALLACFASPIVGGIALAVVGEKPRLGNLQ